ncbi:MULTISPECIES: hypothetical protein [unclassified Streptomyces]|uniref:hypothetical protein n=1 Tax=unclassified Streptomyces TaxID=2593676 RepID=UPI003701CFCF
MTNIDYDAAWAAAPSVAHCERQLRALEERRAALPSAPSPDEARRAVIDEAVTATREGANFPDDIGAKAAAAYRDALEAESERIALHAATTSLRNHLDYLRTVEAETALEALGERLAEFLAEVRKVAPDLKGATSAEGAIEVGTRATAAWRTLTGMVGRLRSIREAQLRILRPLGDGPRLRALRELGHFEVSGLRRDEVPANILRAMTSGAYDVPYLVYLASHPGAWVPASFEQLDGEDVTDVGVADDSLTDSVRWQPRETTIPEPPAPKPTGAERTPQLSY